MGLLVNNKLNYSDQKEKYTWKKVYDNKFAKVDLAEFKGLASSSRGVVLRKSDYRPYSIYCNKDNIDHYVGEALWNWNSDYYESLKGWTKSAVLTRGYHQLLGYCHPTIYKRGRFDEDMNECYESNLQFMRNKFERVKVYDLETAAQSVPTQSSAGVLHPGKTKGEIMESAKKWVRNAIKLFKQGRKVAHIPYKLGLRGHLSPVDENKTRGIWMASAELNIMENMIFRGFYETIKHNMGIASIILTGKNVMPRLHEYITSNEDFTFVNTDVSGWDQLRCRFLMKDVFSKVFKPLINFEEEWQERMFDYLVEDFIYSSLLLPDGTVLTKNHGVPSGSFLTLLFNSVANYIVQKSVLDYLNVECYHPKVLGDDFSFMTRQISQERFDSLIDDISACALKFFALTIKPEKVVITNNVSDRKFIGYQIKNGRLYREVDELFKGVLYPEHEVDGLDISFTRLFAFYVIGGCTQPKFVEFYEYYLSGYYDELKKYGDHLFDLNVMRSGSLRVFKHVYDIDYEAFASLSIDRFRNIFHAKVPFFLTLGSKSLF